MHCHTAWVHWAVEFLQCTASLPRGSGQCDSCNTLPHCLGAVGSRTPAMHCHAARVQWVVELLQNTASLPNDSGQWNSCNALPHYLGQWQCTVSLPRGSGQWDSCNALPHYLGAIGSATPAICCHTALGRWAVQLLSCTATVPWGSGQRNSYNVLAHRLGGRRLLPRRRSLPKERNSCNALPLCLTA